MKLRMIQIILSVFAAAACYYVQTQVRTSVPWLEEDSQGKIQVIMVNAGAAVTAAQWMAVLIIVLGLGIAITGILCLRKGAYSISGDSRILMKIGLLSATVMVVTSFLVNAWGFPTSLTRVLPDGRTATQFWLLSHDAAIAHLLAALVFLSSLAILGCGIAGSLKIWRRNAERLITNERFFNPAFIRHPKGLQ